MIPKHPVWVYDTKIKTPYFVEIQRKTKKERLKPLFFVVPPGLFSVHSNRSDYPQIRIKKHHRAHFLLISRLAPTICCQMLPRSFSHIFNGVITFFFCMAKQQIIIFFCYTPKYFSKNTFNFSITVFFFSCRLPPPKRDIAGSILSISVPTHFTTNWQQIMEIWFYINPIEIASFIHFVGS